MMYLEGAVEGVARALERVAAMVAAVEAVWDMAAEAARVLVGTVWVVGAATVRAAAVKVKAVG